MERISIIFTNQKEIKVEANIQDILNKEKGFITAIDYAINKEVYINLGSILYFEKTQ